MFDGEIGRVRWDTHGRATLSRRGAACRPGAIGHHAFVLSGRTTDLFRACTEASDIASFNRFEGELETIIIFFSTATCSRDEALRGFALAEISRMYRIKTTLSELKLPLLGRRAVQLAYVDGPPGTMGRLVEAGNASFYRNADGVYVETRRGFADVRTGELSWT